MNAVYVIAYAASYLFAASGHAFLSGAALIFAAAAIYCSEYLRTRSLLNLRGLFALGFVGGQGVSCLKLSYLQGDWTRMTWVCFFLAYMGFSLAYELIARRAPAMKRVAAMKPAGDMERLRKATLLLAAVSLVSFVVEAAVLGYIPLFVRGVPHAYSYFHISGLHYFTVSCVLVPALVLVWLLRAGDRGSGKRIPMLLAGAAGFLVPVLCVSRFQFVFAAALLAFTYILAGGRLPGRLAGICGAAAVVAVCGVLSVARSHDAQYLNSIFEMKYEMPVFLSRIYIYIANNYDNFDCLVRRLPEFTWGMRILYPLWALTGLKFLFPELVSFPLYTTKAELTTLTLFYDHYYDFGAAGVFLAAVLTGLVAYSLERIVRKRDDALASVIYAQFAVYMLLSFFTTWFSNPATWFYLAVSVLIYLYCKLGKSC